MFTLEKPQKISETCHKIGQQLDVVDPDDFDDFKETSANDLLNTVLDLVSPSCRLQLSLDQVKKALVTPAQDHLLAEIEQDSQFEVDCDHVD